ncbi:M23 family metallopeptidase [Erysipelotrichaceae bacterium OttesenSCG-928-M19]|nr:M23 family metallopeptidase [Erysipelotrichaceae bacterium OttesenSCG-928-M19]
MAKYQRLIMPMNNVGISQKEGGKFSHKGINAIDLYGKNTKIEQAYAPCDCKVIKKYAYSSMGNAVVFQSTKKVYFADGSINYATFMMMHDNKISDIKVGQVFKQGQKCYDEGSYGYATGNHIHFEIAKGKYAGVAKNGWSLKGHVNTTKALWLIKGKHKIIKTSGNTYKIATSTTVTVAVIKKWSKKKKYKSKVNNLYARLSASTKGKVYRKLHKKTKAINYYGEVTTNGIRWFVYKNVKNKNTYVASQYLKKT